MFPGPEGGVRTSSAPQLPRGVWTYPEGSQDPQNGSNVFYRRFAPKPLGISWQMFTPKVPTMAPLPKVAKMAIFGHPDHAMCTPPPAGLGGSDTPPVVVIYRTLARAPARRGGWRGWCRPRAGPGANGQWRTERRPTARRVSVPSAEKLKLAFLSAHSVGGVGCGRVMVLTVVQVQPSDGHTETLREPFGTGSMPPPRILFPLSSINPLRYKMIQGAAGTSLGQVFPLFRARQRIHAPICHLSFPPGHCLRVTSPPPRGGWSNPPQISKYKQPLQV